MDNDWYERLSCTEIHGRVVCYVEVNAYSHGYPYGAYASAAGTDMEETKARMEQALERIRAFAQEQLKVLWTQ